MNYQIDSKANIGVVCLQTANLNRAVEFYKTNIGLKVFEPINHHSTVLGVGENPLIRLIELEPAQMPGRTTGLYHIAILLPSRQDLSKTLHQLIKMQTPISGFADHLVSEAVYLNDLDGNGIEIYRDRPRNQWLYEKGQIRIDTLPLDVRAILEEVEAGDDMWEGLPPQTRIGHIHLRVSSLEPALRFYTEVLGFDLIMRYGPSAGFVSAGGYHHHIGLNTWESAGAPPPPKSAIGLKWYTINLSSQEMLDMLQNNISKAGLATRPSSDGLMIQDPSGIQIRVIANG